MSVKVVKANFGQKRVIAAFFAPTELTNVLQNRINQIPIMKNLLVLSLIFILASCNTEDRTLYVTFDKANGLGVGDPVIVNEFRVGHVEDVVINEHFKIVAEILLNKPSKIPTDSKFIVGTYGLFSKAIFVDLGTSTRYLTHKDKINGLYEAFNPVDSLIDFVHDQIDMSTPVRNQDTIKDELKELNDQLKEQNKKVSPKREETIENND